MTRSPAPLPRSTDDPAPGAGPVASAPGVVAGIVSLAMLLCAAAATLGVAISRPGVAPAQHAPVAATEATLVRDVLTGRASRSDGTPEPPATGPGSPAEPLRLRFVPSSDTSQSGPAIDELLAFLRRRTGYAIEGAILRSYALVVEEIAQGRCDIAFLTATSYERAWRLTRGAPADDDITVILSVVRQGSGEHPGSDLAYRGAIVVRKDSPLASVAQLDGSRSIALGGPTSGAGSILPSEMLNAQGLRPRISRYEGYTAILTAVVQGAVDAGAIWWSPPNRDNPQNDARINARDLYPDIFETTRILGFTAWIPNEPVVARKALPEPVRHVMARALALYVAGKAVSEEGRRSLESIGSLIGLIPASDDDFAPLHEVVERAFAADPEGREDFLAGKGR